MVNIRKTFLKGKCYNNTETNKVLLYFPNTTFYSIAELCFLMIRIDYVHWQSWVGSNDWSFSKSMHHDVTPCKTKLLS